MTEEVTPSWLKSIEDAIVDKLTPALSPLPVEAVSDKSSNFVHARGDALVMLMGIRPAGKAPAALVLSAQQLELSFEVYLRSRSLKDQSGLYPMLNAAMQALLGFKPAGAEPLTLADSQLEGQTDGVWAWSLNLNTQMMWVPCLDETEEGPLFNAATFSNCKEDCDECL